MVDVLAAAILIAGVVPPDDTTGAVPVTDVTYPKVGMSAATKALNVGKAAAPVVGPAST